MTAIKPKTGKSVCPICNQRLSNSLVHRIKLCADVHIQQMSYIIVVKSVKLCYFTFVSFIVLSSKNNFVSL